ISSYGSFYQWYLNGSPVAGATDSSYIALQGGAYAVRITDSLGCSSISNSVTILGISTFYPEEKMMTYPNPADKEFTVYGLQFTVGATIEIYNVLGEKVYSR